jgi:amino acid adenylation domain-containing protein
MANLVDIKERLARLSPEQRALLTERLDKGDKLTPDSVEMETAKPLRTDELTQPGKATRTVSIYPASHGQKRMWFLHEYADGVPVYVSPSSFHLVGPINQEILQQSVSDLVQRHEALRTTFVLEDGELVQHIDSGTEYSWETQDFEALTDSERTEAVQRCLDDVIRRRFDLAVEPGFRVVLARLGPEEHVLCLVLHHINSDGWSRSNLWRDLGAFYKARVSSSSAKLKPLPVQFNDYAAWQQRQFSGGLLANQVEYWKSQLSGQLDPLDLPADRPSPLKDSFQGAQASLELEPELIARLTAHAQEEGATLFMILLAAYKVLLFRYTDRDDLVVGVPIANRQRSDVENLVGLFVNTLAIRTNLSGEPSFREMLGRVKESVLQAYSHQDRPFEQLVEMLPVSRENSAASLFQTSFALQDFPSVGLDLPKVQSSPWPTETHTSKFDLSLSVEKGDDGWAACSEYSTDLFDADRMERMLGHWHMILESIASDPDQALTNIPILTAPERHQLLVEWNDTAVDYPDKCVHQLFEEQVERTPDAVAVVFEGKQLTYRELNKKANQVAHCLIEKGVGPDVLVAICVERSLEMIVGLLGILKAGGAYVPLDPEYPKDRLAFMLQDSGKPLLVTTKDLSKPFVDLAEDLLFMEKDLVEKGGPIENPRPSINSDHLAYVIYTSGSTGRPKGVEIPHRGIVRLVSNTNYCHFDHRKVFLQFAPISFDAATFEIWGALLHGARLVLAPSGRDAIDRIPDLIKRHGITTAWLTAGLFNQFVERDPEVLNGLDELLIGGEALQPQQVAKAIDRLPRIRLINGYGPTENTTFTSTFQIEECDGDSAIPIGGPIANSQIYIFNGALRSQPIGVAGELYIGGAGLARGYLNRPDLTKERFVEIEILGKPERLYRSGDLCRWRADGNLEFLGRIDHQVKIRGFRIELGEVEAALGAFPGIRECVVIATEDNRGDKRLIAYIVSDQDHNTSTPAIRRALAEKLPDYMIPAVFVPLDALPLTPNGKVDRRALPAPEMDRTTAGMDYTAPRTPIEEALGDIWSEALGLKQVGIHDNFFNLGGHSLIATRVVSRIHSVFEIELPLRKLFDSPTIRELAQEIETLRQGETQSPKTALTTIDPDRTGPLPLSFAQQRLWFLEQLEEELTAYNMPSANRLGGALNVEALRQAFEIVLHRHEALRTSFTMHGDHPVQVIGEVAHFELPVVDLAHLSPDEREKEVTRLRQQEAEKPFDLTQGPMLRAQLLRLAEDDHVFLMTMHHIASDGWSMGILWRELSDSYASLTSGQKPILPDLSIQYADYALWQREQLHGQRLDELLQYWRGQLEGISPLELPTDHPRPPVPTYHGAVHEFEVPGELRTLLQSLSQAEGVTLHMTLLAAFQVLLSRYSGQDDITVGMPIAGRNHEDLEGLIGFFINTLVLRSDLSGNPTFQDLLGQVRETSLEAYDHQELPFEKLVEELQPERDRSRSPLVQVLFQLLDFGDQERKLKGLEIESLPSTSEQVRCDLEVHLWQKPESLTGNISYSTDLFDHTTIQRLTEHFLTLLQGIAATHQSPIGELPLLTEAEQHQLLVEWNDTAVEYPDKCVHQLFEEQVGRTPDAAAVVFEGQELTYRELNQRANQLAHCLIEKGVGPDNVVGICVERSPEMIVGLLGILKAGGAYAPLDPKFPADRLAFVVEDTAMSVLVTQHRLEGCCGKNPPIVIWLDEFNKTGILDNPEPSGSPTSLAYTIHTSGSTGKPKGVEIQHQTLVNCLCHFERNLKIGREDSWLAITTLAFDIAALEIWLPLVVGAKVIVASRETAQDGRRLAGVLHDSGASILQGTPATWQELLASGWRGSPELQILCGGEAIPQDLADQLATLSRTSWNVYGPTETTIWSTVSRLIPSQSPTIGKPLSNTRVYLLDKNQVLVPIGVAGELHIGGDGLARGYLNRPELSGERFLEIKVGGETERLYRTGDLCRWKADGNLEFLGRIDHQVKIRGFRIELGEIETVLGAYPDIKECVVIAREDNPGDKRLIAYIVSDQDQNTSPSNLRRALAEKLPDYMIPAAFVPLDILPLTPNGKVDRRALPAPEMDRTTAGVNYTAPRTPIEEELAAIWEEMLGLDRVGIYDNFFDLGGHSLQAAALASQIEKLTGKRLPISAFFQSPAVASLAHRLTDEKWAPKWSSLVPLQPLGSNPPLFILHGWGGDVYGFTEMAKCFAPEQPVYGVQAVGLDGHRPKHRTVEEMAQHYVEEIRSFQPEGPYHLCGFSLGGLIALETAQQLHKQDQKVAILYLLDTHPIGPVPLFLRILILVLDIPKRFLFHLQQVRKVPMGERIYYLKGRWYGLQNLILRNRKKPRTQKTLDSEGSLKRLESPDHYHKIALSYRPTRYTGSLHLVLSEVSGLTVKLYWQFISLGKASFHRINCNHGDLIKSKNSPEVVKTFSSIIECTRNDSIRNNANKKSRAGDDS